MEDALPQVNKLKLFLAICGHNRDFADRFASADDGGLPGPEAFSLMNEVLEQMAPATSLDQGKGLGLINKSTGANSIIFGDEGTPPRFTFIFKTPPTGQETEGRADDSDMESDSADDVPVIGHISFCEVPPSSTVWTHVSNDDDMFKHLLLGMKPSKPHPSDVTELDSEGKVVASEPLPNTTTTRIVVKSETATSGTVAVAASAAHTAAALIIKQAPTSGTKRSASGHPLMAPSPTLPLLRYSLTSTTMVVMVSMIQSYGDTGELARALTSKLVDKCLYLSQLARPATEYPLLYRCMSVAMNPTGVSRRALYDYFMAHRFIMGTDAINMQPASGTILSQVRLEKVRAARLAYCAAQRVLANILGQIISPDLDESLKNTMRLSGVGGGGGAGGSGSSLATIGGGPTGMALGGGRRVTMSFAGPIESEGGGGGRRWRGR